MKKIYWRPRAVSRTALALIAFLSIAGMVLVENIPSVKRQPYFREKEAAAHLARAGMDAIREARLAAGYEIDTSKDPAESGMVGVAMSPVTSISGVLEAKQTSVNPNFAAVVLQMLKEAGVGEGDTVAVGVSGSFPGINLSVYAAMETLSLKPIIIPSASASQWGANIPDLLWIDMERLLHERGLISFRSIAASIGGYEDSGLGLPEDGIASLKASIERNGLPLLESPDSFEGNIDLRLQEYKKAAKGAPIKCYINVGGGTISVGRSLGKHLFKPGLNRRLPIRAKQVDGLMSRFAAEKIPVIHLVQINDLAQQYGMEIAPKVIPEVGEANVFEAVGYNNWLAAGVLAAILLAMFAFIRSDVGFRLFQRGTKKDSGHPEPMV